MLDIVVCWIQLSARHSNMAESVIILTFIFKLEQSIRITRGYFWPRNSTKNKVIKYGLIYCTKIFKYSTYQDILHKFIDKTSMMTSLWNHKSASEEKWHFSWGIIWKKAHQIWWKIKKFPYTKQNLPLLWPLLAQKQ